MKRACATSIISLLAAVQIAAAFPGWIGTYGIYKKHDDRSNPGQFSTMMNEDYEGLQAAVGIQVNGGNWVEYPMDYSGNIDGNSYWTFTPAFRFPGGSVVNYYFHGYDGQGNHIWDSRAGLNYEFTVSPDPEPYVQQIAADKWVGNVFANGITVSEEYNIWIDFKIKYLGSPMAIGIVWTWNNWQDWRSATAEFEGDLENGFQQWGVDLLPAGIAYSHRSLGFIRWFPEDSTEYMDVTDKRVTIKYAIFYQVGGTWYWDNNGGSDYKIVIGQDEGDPNDTDADGLLDAWEMEHFGDLSQGPDGNPDGDGVIGIPMANMIEFATGNNPNVPNDPMGVRLLWANAYPVPGSSVTLSYVPGNEASPLFGKPVYAHVGKNGWQDVYDTAQLEWNGQTSRYEISITVPGDADELNVVFTDRNGSWDNNNGSDWTIKVNN